MISAKGYFDGNKKKKTLKELEEERIAWRQQEEIKRQKEAEEAQKRQELIDLELFEVSFDYLIIVLERFFISFLSSSYLYSFNHTSRMKKERKLPRQKRKKKEN
jgi:hypothetical protein